MLGDGGAIIRTQNKIVHGLRDKKNRYVDFERVQNQDYDSQTLSVGKNVTNVFKTYYAPKKEVSEKPQPAVPNILGGGNPLTSPLDILKKPTAVVNVPTKIKPVTVAAPQAPQKEKKAQIWNPLMM